MILFINISTVSNVIFVLQQAGNRWNQYDQQSQPSSQNIWAQQQTPNWNSHPQQNAQSWGDLKGMT